MHQIFIFNWSFEVNKIYFIDHRILLCIISNLKSDHIFSPCEIVWFFKAKITIARINLKYSNKFGIFK